MKTKYACVVLLFLLASVFVGPPNGVEASTRLDSYIDSDLHLTKEGSPYEVVNNLYVAPGHTVTIDPGVTLLFSAGEFYIDRSNLRIGSASSSEKVLIDVTASSSGTWLGIYLDYGTADIRSLEVRNAGKPIYSLGSSVTINDLKVSGDTSNSSIGVYAMEGSLHISSSTISHYSNTGVYAYDAVGFINSSDISDNGRGIFYDGTLPKSFSGIRNTFSENNFDIFNVNEATTIDFTGNDWGTGGAPEPEKIFGRVTTGYEEPEKCCSSVVFLPGFQASRLNAGGNQLWEPNRNADVEKLYLDENGTSVNPSVTVGEIIKKTNAWGPLGSQNIYQSFAESMDNMVTNSTINAWKALPYDWRLDLIDVTESMVTEIEQVASSSQNGKVTIVTHSNGGLVAKKLLETLRREGKEGLVSKLVMVAAPQLGTPKVIPSLLHGDGQEYLKGMIMSKENARAWGENMTGAYNFLPTEEYVNTVSSPLVWFDASLDKINNWRSTYGDSITTKTELDSFLLGDEGRGKPSASDLANPNILNATPLYKASLNHDRLDNFVPAYSTKLYQIAGWGKSTPSGIRYRASKHCGFLNFFCIGTTGLGIDHENVETFDGDGTVISASATALPDLLSTTYYVDMKKINDHAGTNYDHATFFEIPATLSLVRNLIIGNTTSSVEDVSMEKPSASSIANLELSVHSPVDIHAYDKNGRHTGIVPRLDAGSDLTYFEERIPNSSYREVGEGKYINIQNPKNETIKLQGNGIGTFTLRINETKDENQSSMEFADIPVTEMTKAELVVSSGFASTTLSLDVDGDNKIDFIVKPSAGVDPILYLGVLKKTIQSFALKPLAEKQIVNKIDKVIKLLTKDKIKAATNKLSKFSAMLNKKNWKTKKISETDKNEIIRIINETLDAI